MSWVENYLDQKPRDQYSTDNESRPSIYQRQPGNMIFLHQQLKAGLHVSMHTVCGVLCNYRVMFGDINIWLIKLYNVFPQLRIHHQERG